MPGIYFHIPFCKKACHYCNFHFSTSIRHRVEMTQALEKEIELRQDYLHTPQIETIYFGGGTPSILPVGDLAQIFETTSRFFSWPNHAEITLEANPDDISEEWLEDLKQYTPVNRLSIGIQSFFEEDLLWMNRAHNASEARKSIELAIAKGFSNLTVDLIYGTPMLTMEKWIHNLEILLSYPIPHISCYCLTVEKGTALGHFVNKGQQPPVNEDLAALQFEYLMEKAQQSGFEHYEISNFALPGQYARHNTAYWTGEHYLGIGPSAHSYNGSSRSWNIANNAKYMEGISNRNPIFEQEILSVADQFNEYVMTMLRTQWGCSLRKLQEISTIAAKSFEIKAKKWETEGSLQINEGQYILTPKGRLIADGIASDLFCEL